MTEEDFRVEIRVHAIREYGGLTKMAKAIGLSRNNLYGAVNGRHSPAQKILDDMNAKRTLSYSF